VDFFTVKTQVGGCRLPDLLLGNVGTAAKVVAALGDLIALIAPCAASYRGVHVSLHFAFGSMR
jgi:hypothetical protein